MAQTLAKLTRAEYEKLCMFDYGDLYSIHRGLKHTFFGKHLQIFVCVNRYGKLYIQVNFYPEGHKSFDFDCLDEAVDWAKRRVTVVSVPEENAHDPRKCRFFQSCYGGDRCTGTKELDFCEGEKCKRWKPSEEDARASD